MKRETEKGKFDKRKEKGKMKGRAKMRESGEQKEQ